MIDAEVVRLRKLRNVALRARALAKALESESIENNVFARSAVLCWTISRIATGRLRAHPYLSYQQGPSPMRELADRAAASMTALAARRQNLRFSAYAPQLQCVAREVADARALTWSADLSDALGRAQLQLRRLATELDAGVQHEAGAHATAMPRITAIARAPENVGALEELGQETHWPYLAI
jgi:hypothetical protein